MGNDGTSQRDPPQDDKGGRGHPERVSPANESKDPLKSPETVSDVGGSLDSLTSFAHSG